MKTEDIFNFPNSDNPVLCTDGKMGMLVIYPTKEGLCGIQVYGEEDCRWIHSDDLSSTSDGAMRQTGSPRLPPSSAQHDMAQMMLVMDWIGRGGMK